MINFFLIIIEDNPDIIKKHLTDILNRSDFAGLRESWLDKQFDSFLKLEAVKSILNFLKYIIEFIVRILLEPASGYIISAILFVLLGIILIYLIFRIKNRIALSAGDDKNRKITENRVETSFNLEKSAENLATNGKFSEAIQELFLSLLIILGQKGILEYSQSRTNREAERILKSSGNVEFQKSFQSLNRLFEEKIYALLPCSSQEYRIFLETYQNCKREIFQ